MTDHAVSVVGLNHDDGLRYRWTCSCGRRGVRTTEYRLAEAQGQAHVEYTTAARRIAAGTGAEEAGR